MHALSSINLLKLTVKLLITFLVYYNMTDAGRIILSSVFVQFTEVMAFMAITT